MKRWSANVETCASNSMLSSNTTPRLLALLAVVVSIAFPILKSLNSGRVRYIEKISTISVLSWLVSWARFYTPRWVLVGTVVIFAKGENRQERIWEPISLMVYNDLMVYRKLLKSVWEFKKEDCFPVVVKFDMEITYDSSKQMQSGINPVTLRL